MHSSPTVLLQQRAELLEQMKAIDSLRRGSLSRQFFKYQQDGQTLERGPYFLLQGFFQGKKFAERIPGEQASVVEKQVENYQRFQALAERFLDVSDLPRVDVTDGHDIVALLQGRIENLAHAPAAAKQSQVQLAVGAFAGQRS